MKHLEELKIFTATYVAESDLAAKDKVWLIDFIKEGEYDDIIDILEGEYQLPQISDYLAEKLWRALKAAKSGWRSAKYTYKTGKKMPRAGGRPLQVRGNLGWSKYVGAKQKRKATEKAFKKQFPDIADKKTTKAFVKPLKSAERKAAGAAMAKTGATAGGIALAGVGAQTVYKQQLSKAASACKGKPNKEACIAAYRKKALAAKNIHKIKKLKVSKSDCINARNPVKCRQRIDARVKKLKEEFILSERGGLMHPLGIAFDVLFVFELGQMAYKRFFSKAAKACKGSPDRRLCVLRYKVKAKEAQIRAIRSKAGLCSKDKNPAACKGKISRKLRSLRSDVEMLKQELG